jgi:hypothetical protein
MTGQKIRIGNARLTTDKSGKVRVAKVVKFRDASHAIRAKKSKKSRPVRRVV